MNKKMETVLVVVSFSVIMCPDKRVLLVQSKESTPCNVHNFKGYAANILVPNTTAQIKKSYGVHASTDPSCFGGTRVPTQCLLGGFNVVADVQDSIKINRVFFLERDKTGKVTIAYFNQNFWVSFKRRQVYDTEHVLYGDVCTKGYIFLMSNLEMTR